MSFNWDKHLMASGNVRKRNVFVNNFIGGLAWGVGSVLGATIIISILFGLLRNFNFIPGVSQFIDQVDEQRLPKQLRSNNP